MHYAIDQDAEKICVRLRGQLLPGSDQNSVIETVVKDLRAALETSSASELVVDCSDLIYSYGDAIASLWLVGLQHKLRCRIRATGATRESLAELMKITIAVPISE